MVRLGGGIFFKERDNILPVSPEQTISNLIDDITSLNLQNGIENSLDSKLNATTGALQDIDENNNVAAINALQSFINAVKAQSGKKISESNTQALIDATHAIINSLNPSRETVPKLDRIQYQFAYLSKPVCI